MIENRIKTQIRDSRIKPNNNSPKFSEGDFIKLDNKIWEVTEYLGLVQPIRDGIKIQEFEHIYLIKKDKRKLYKHERDIISKDLI